MDFHIVLTVGLNLLVGVVIGFLVGLTGIGGGALVLPALIYVLKIPALYAVGTGLLFSALCRTGAIFYHHQLKTIRKRNSVFFLAGSIPAVLLSSWFLNRLAARVELHRLDHDLQIAIAGILLLACVALVGEEYLRAKKGGNGPRRYYVPPEDLPLRLKLGGIFFGALTGFIMGTTSIGGGVIIIPILSSFFNFSPLDTVGTSILISMVLALLGSLAYIFNGNIILSAAILLTIGALPGASVGSRLAARMPPRALKMLIFSLILLSAISLFLRA